MKISKLVRAKFRVKINSLAEEARIIRKEEKRCGSRDSDRGSLRFHRTGIVRSEQRATLLAYAFMRGVPYSAVERNARPVEAKAIERICKSLSWQTVDVSNWIKPVEQAA
jgi:hypothetical protein